MNCKEVAVQACFKEQLSQDCEYTPMFALIQLVTPEYDGLVYCEESNQIVNNSAPIKIDLDKDGCFKSCGLFPNTALNVKDKDGNPASYYEVLILAGATENVAPQQTSCRYGNSVNGLCGQASCGYCYRTINNTYNASNNSGKVVAEVVLTERFILDDRDGLLPACVDLVDVLVTGASCAPSALQCNLFKSCETSWLGVAGPGIAITAGDNPDGNALNGHAPTVAVAVSSATGNAVTLDSEGLFVALNPWDCNELNACSVSAMNDVDTAGISVGEVLHWNGAALVPGPKAQVAVVDGDCTTGVIYGSGSIQNPWTVQFDIDISAGPENQAVCVSDGLYVPPSTIVVQGSANDCLVTQAAGSGTLADPVVVSTDVLLSAAANNVLSCTTSGLMVPDQSTHVQSCFSEDCNNPMDVTCVDLTISGTGAASDPFVFCPEIVVNNSVDNILACTPDGLMVDCATVADQIGLNAGNGLAYNHPTKSLSVLLSSDPNNAASFGSDGGVYVPVAMAMGVDVNLVGSASDCIATAISGLGTLSDPFRVATDLVIDNDPNNYLSCGPDGLFVDSPRIQIGSTSCIDLSVTGLGTSGDPFIFNAAAVISAAADNALDCVNGELYVPVADGSETEVQLVAGPGIDGSLAGSGSGSDPYILSVDAQVDPSLANLLQLGPDGLFVGPMDGSETIIQVANGDCVNTQLFGAGTSAAPYVLQSDVVVSGDSSNIASCTNNGLYVPAPSLTVNGSDCVAVALSGDSSPSNPWNVDVDIVISSASDNFLSCQTDGLFVAAPIVTANGSNCLSLAVTGSGVSSDPFAFTGSVDVDPSADNIISCGLDGLVVEQSALANAVINLISNGMIDIPVSSAPNQCLFTLSDGLFVACPDGSETVVQYIDGDSTSASIAGSGTSTNPYVLQTDVVIAANADNLLQSTTAGLYAPATSLGVTDTQSIDLTLSGLGTQAAPYDVRADLIVSAAADNAFVSQADGAYVADRGYLALAGTDACLSLALAGSGLASDPYGLSGGINISSVAGNALSCESDGLFVASSGLLAVADSDCIDLTLSGDGSTATPYLVSADIILDGLQPNMISCGTDGLLVSPEDVRDIVRNMVGDGITLDGSMNLAVDISNDSGNLLTVGSDFGLYVALADGSETVLLVSDSNTLDLSLSGTGTTTDPYLVSGDVRVDPDPCNALESTPNGLVVRDSTAFEIGQEGLLDAQADNPAMWRAWEDGEVEFKIAGLGFASTSASATNFRIIDQSGNVVYTGVIPAGGSYDLLSVGPISVSPGQGFAAQVIAPFPADNGNDAACGLVIQGKFTSCS